MLSADGFFSFLAGADRRCYNFLQQYRVKNIDLVVLLAENFFFSFRRGARVADWARLEIVCTPNTGTGGSNPPLSVSGDS